MKEPAWWRHYYERFDGIVYYGKPSWASYSVWLVPGQHHE